MSVSAVECETRHKDVQHQIDAMSDRVNRVQLAAIENITALRADIKADLLATEARINDKFTTASALNDQKLGNVKAYIIGAFAGTTTIITIVTFLLFFFTR